MNNQQLKELLTDKFPDELTVEELDAIRQRLSEAPELRAILRENLQLDRRLTQALDQVQLPADDLYRRVHILAKPGYIAPIAGLLLCLAVGALAAGIVFSIFKPYKSAFLPDASTEAPAVTKLDDAAAAADTSASTDTATETTGDEPPEPALPAVMPVDPATTGAANFPMKLEAEAFARGNLQIDNSQWGDATTKVVATGDAKPAYAEFEFNVSAAGKYNLRLRYASFDSRPLKLTVNDKTRDGFIAGEQTGGNNVPHLKWFDVAEIDLKKGGNTLRLATGSNFPHIDQLEIDTIPSSRKPPANPLAGGPGVADPGAPGPGTPAPDPADPTDPPPPVQPHKVTPWTAVVEDAKPPAFSEVAFRQFSVSRDLPQPDTLKEWFDTVPGQSSRITEARTQHGRCAAIDGVLKLKSPWLDDSALKLSLDQFDHLRIHLFTGLKGVTLQYNLGRANHGWAAYAVTREKADAPVPATYLLTATDLGRSRSTELRYGGPVSIRWRSGEILLTRGDIELLRAPMPERPAETYFHGKAQFHGIQLVRTTDEPFAPPVPFPVAADITKPASLEWKLFDETKDTNLTRNDDGSIRLHANNAGRKTWAVAPLPASGLHEYVFQLKDVTPGTGIFLARSNNHAHDLVRFVSDRRGAMCAVFSGNDDSRERDMPKIEDQLVTFAGSNPWVKLVYGIGSLRWWISPDGVHWGEGYEQWQNLPGDLTGIGLQYAAHAPGCGITLQRVVIREISPIIEIVGKDLYQQAKSFHTAGNLSEWLEQAKKTLPDGTEKEAWLTACAIRSLGGGCRQGLGRDLRDLVFSSQAYQQQSFEKKLKSLSARTLIDDGFHHYDSLNKLAELFHQAAREAYAAGDPQAYTQMRHAMMSAPVYTNHYFKQYDEQLIRDQIVMLMSRRRFATAVRFCDELEFYHQQRDIKIIEWARAIAMRRLPRQRGDDTLPRLKEEWRQPYVEELNKKAYNVIAELRAILASDAHDDAARFIANLDAAAFEGLAPVGEDERLLTSLPVMVRAAMNRHPQLRKSMRDNFADIAMLRVRRAIAASDSLALEAAAMQFQGTPAAAEAMMWLGDRALSSGWFARAAASYREAEAAAGIALRSELAPRLRLAAAMQGKNAGEPATDDVTFGEVTMSSNEFESLIKEMRSQQQDQAAPLQTVVTADAPAPREMKPGNRLKIEGSLGEDQSNEVTRHTRTYKADWANRQLAVVQEGDTAYIANRFQIAAFDLAAGKQKWRTERLPEKMAKSQSWTFTAMQPCFAGSRIYSRMLYGESAVLACFEKESGKLVWSTTPATNESLIAGPLLIQDQLAGLLMQRDERGAGRVQLATFDRQTGEIVSRHDLVSVRSSWWGRRYCEAVALHDGLVASLGGVVFNCNLEGRVRWVRQQMTMPVEEEPAWVQQHFQAPLLHNGRLYIAQPGVRNVECVDAATGQIVWTTYLHDIQRLGGMLSGKNGNADALLLQTNRGFEAVSLAGGKRLWSHQTSKTPLTTLMVAKAAVVYAVQSKVDGKTVPELVWLSHDGKSIAAHPVKELQSDDPRTGPLVSAPSGKFWTTYVNGGQTNQLELIELKQ